MALGGVRAVVAAPRLRRKNGACVNAHLQPKCSTKADEID